MSRRRRGRPPKTEHEAFGQLLWFERLFEEEIAAQLGRGLTKPKKVLQRTAVRLGVSERSAWMLKAEIERENARFEQTIASLQPLLRELRDRLLEKNGGTDLFAGYFDSPD